MIIDLRGIPPAGKRFSGSEPSSILEVTGDENVTAIDDLRYELVAQVVSERLIVRGVVGLRLRFRCSRCSEFYDAHIEEKAFFCDREVTTETESADLTADMREAILLIFPAYPVCGPDCKGLCPRCGTNLNTGSCSCSQPEDQRWNALDGFGGLGRVK